MATSSANKISVVVYLDPDSFRYMEDQRNPNMPRSVYYSTVLKKAFGIMR
jgi:hypothetical protein